MSNKPKVGRDGCAEHSKHMLKAKHKHFGSAELPCIVDAVSADFWFVRHFWY